MKRRKQLSLFSDKRNSREWGGEASIGKIKSCRPLNSQKYLHIVLKSSHAIKDKTFSHANNKGMVHSLLKTYLSLCGITLYEMALMKNHIHLLVQLPNRILFQKFLRIFLGVVARKMLNAEKGRAGKVPYWDNLPYTRIVEKGRDFINVVNYIKKNVLDSIVGIDFNDLELNPLPAFLSNHPPQILGPPTENEIFLI